MLLVAPYPGAGKITGLSLPDSQFGEEKMKEAFQSILKLLTGGQLSVSYLIRMANKPTILTLVPIPDGWRAMLHLNTCDFGKVSEGGVFSFKVSHPESGVGDSIRFTLCELRTEKPEQTDTAQ